MLGNDAGARVAGQRLAHVESFSYFCYLDVSSRLRCRSRSLNTSLSKNLRAAFEAFITSYREHGQLDATSCKETGQSPLPSFSIQGEGDAETCPIYLDSRPAHYRSLAIQIQQRTRRGQVLLLWRSSMQVVRGRKSMPK